MHLLFGGSVQNIAIPLIENFALILVLAYVLGKLPRHVVDGYQFGVPIVIGVIFGAATVIAMNMPIGFSDGVFYDSRAIFIVLAGPFGGYLATIIAGVIALLYQLYLGGADALPSIVDIFLPVLLGLILVKFPLGDDQKLRTSKLALCGVFLGVLVSPVALLLPDKKLGLELLESYILTLPFIFMVAFPIADAILHTQVWNVVINETNTRDEEALRGAQKIGHFGNWEYDILTQQQTWSDEVYRLFEHEPALGPLKFSEIASYCLDESRELLKMKIDQTIKLGQSHEGDFSFILPSGRLVHQFTAIHPVLNNAGEVIKLLGTVQDITDRKNAEEKLKLTEEQRRALFKSIPVPINCWRQVGDDFELFDYNEASLLVSDGKIAENIGVMHSVYNPARPDILSDMKRCITLHETFSKESSRSEFNQIQMRDLIITFAYCPPDVVMVMLEDITEQKKNSHELKLSEQRFKDFARTAADDLWETDAAHRYVYFATNFGDEFEPLLGKTRWETDTTLHESSKWGAHRADIRAHRAFRDFRYARKDKTGRYRYLRVNGTPIFDQNNKFKGYRGTTFDETAEVDVRDAARSAQEIFSEAMENVSEGIILWDASDRLVMRNSRYIEMFPDMASITDPGVTLKNHTNQREELGYVLTKIQNPEKAGAAKINGGLGQNTVVDIVAKGSLQYRIRQEVLANGRKIIFHTDITEEKHQEEQLHQALKMEAVGQLTGGIAHDFNNILSAVLGNLELILQKWSDDEKLASRINRAKISVLRGAELTRRLLAFSRKQNLNPKPTYLGDLVAGMHDLLERSLGEHVTIRNTSDKDLWAVMVDVNLMENAILNLSINARDAMPVGGTLSINCKNMSAEEVAKLELAKEVVGACVCVDIFDTGDGMPPEHLERVFEPFFTTKEVGRGSGLGLSMVYGFVSQSGGYVDISSVVEKGTKVSLYLPKYEGEVEHAVATADREELLMGRGEKILVVEDDPDVRDMTLSLLSRLGYKPYDCGDGLRLYEMASDDIKKFDMLLSDVVLPNGISGPIVAKHTREIAPEINVLLMTGYADRDALFDKEEKSQFPIINKPFRADEFSQMIYDILS